MHDFFEEDAVENEFVNCSQFTGNCENCSEHHTQCVWCTGLEICVHLVDITQCSLKSNTRYGKNTIGSDCAIYISHFLLLLVSLHSFLALLTLFLSLSSHSLHFLLFSLTSFLALLTLFLSLAAVVASVWEILANLSAKSPVQRDCGRALMGSLDSSCSWVSMGYCLLVAPT